MKSSKCYLTYVLTTVGHVLVLNIAQVGKVKFPGIALQFWPWGTNPRTHHGRQESEQSSALIVTFSVDHKNLAG